MTQTVRWMRTRDLIEPVAPAPARHYTPRRHPACTNRRERILAFLAQNPGSSIGTIQRRLRLPSELYTLLLRLCQEGVVRVDDDMLFSVEEK